MLYFIWSYGSLIEGGVCDLKNIMPDNVALFYCKPNVAPIPLESILCVKCLGNAFVIPIVLNFCMEKGGRW